MSVVQREHLRSSPVISAAGERVLRALVEGGPAAVAGSVEIRAAAGSDNRAWIAAAALLRAGFVEFVRDGDPAIRATSSGRRYLARGPASRGRHPKRRHNRG